MKQLFHWSLGLAAASVLIGCSQTGQLSADHSATQATSSANQLESWSFDHQRLVLKTSQGTVAIAGIGDGAMMVDYFPDSLKHQSQLPSFALDEQATIVKGKVIPLANGLGYCLTEICVKVQEQPFQLSYVDEQSQLHSDDPLLSEDSGLYVFPNKRGFRFELDDNEQLLGGGQRIAGLDEDGNQINQGMDRRGQRYELYNKASYGYEAGETPLMYYGMPAVISSKGYALAFDNSAKGYLDLGHSDQEILQFEAVSGRTAYLVAAGKSYPKLLENFTAAIGRQPLPPRWSFGNYASRFGYHNQAEVEQTIAKFAAADIPVDAVVMDIFWFGKDIQGHMGNLQWDSQAFPNHRQMIKDLEQQGVKTVLITEPFVLTTSKRWQQAVNADALALDLAGDPKRFDFYFGNTGLIDVFHQPSQQWFAEIYAQLAQDGIHGWWGDLGEPEVHPSDTVHRLDGQQYLADEIHNAYGHQWAKNLYQQLSQLQPEQRPMILMRSGFVGSQRYGMIPWTGDVSRSWGGLKPQVELALQMGMLGQGYIHSDLGGFAGGEQFDPELYTRWMQYGVFQPIYRPHAQEHIAPEVVFHSQAVQDRLRPFIKLRYQLLPYLYTLAYENSRFGLPMMRPLTFLDPSQFNNKDSYLFGDSMLVTPVVEAGATQVSVNLPQGVWFDLFTGERFVGGNPINQPTTLDTFPVLIKAGSFIPSLAPVTQTGSIVSTQDYDTQQIIVDYYFDASVRQSSGQMYDDDGQTPDAIATQAFELLNFHSEFDAARSQLTLKVQSTGKMQHQMRDVQLVIKHLPQAALAQLKTVLINDKPQILRQQGQELVIALELDKTQPEQRITLAW